MAPDPSTSLLGHSDKPGRADVRGCPPPVAGEAYGFIMTAEASSSPSQAGPYEVIHLGGQAAAIVPLGELRRLRAVERHASPDAREEAEIEVTLATHDDWVAAGCPGALSHDEVMAELLHGPQ
jgi:uncharacterized protein (DUF849 family)